MSSIRNLCLAAMVLTGTAVYSQLLEDSASPPVPPLPSDLPAHVKPPAPRAINPTVRSVRPQPRPTARPVARPRLSGPRTLADNILAWDEISKDYQAKPGEATAPFRFALTNVSNEEVTINWVRPSCGCTVAKLPPTPWKLAPGDHGDIELDVDLRGKYGTLSKYVSIDTSHGQKMLNIRVHIPTAQQQMAGGVDARTKNMQLAMADRQVVFRGECASCHSAPAIGKMGGDLFSAACAICHEAPHRATMVPDLAALTINPTKDYWKHWITHGKPGSLMPAFSKEQGGPLTPEQIESLAEYLAEEFPQRKVAAADHDHDDHDHDHAAGDGHDHSHQSPALAK